MISELGDLWITCSILAVSAYIIHYFKNYGKLPVLFCKPGSKFDSFIRKRVPSSKTRYMPLYWFAESRCQTILRYFLPCFARITCRREVVRPSNGGQFYLEWYDNVTSNSFLDCETRPTIIILPGITSTSDSSYIKSMVGRLLNRGYRVIILVYRGLQNMEVLVSTYIPHCPFIKFQFEYICNLDFYFLVPFDVLCNVYKRSGAYSGNVQNAAPKSQAFCCRRIDGFTDISCLFRR